jgi:uncharacterized spore protein YtfJ
MEVDMPTFVEMVEQVNASIGAKRVFGEPYEKNGVTVIPAARVMGGVGGGEDMTKTGGPRGGKGEGVAGGGVGGGFGLAGGPAGAYVIRGDRVFWVPAVDVNRLMLGFQVVMVVFLLTIRTIVKTRAKTTALQAVKPV